MQKLDDEQLEGSGFVLNGIVNVILEIYKVNDIQASSWVELPEKYKNNKSIINIKNDDQFCFLWCILEHLCQKQQPTNITFSWKDHIKFEDYHMSVPVPIRVYADFECIIQPQNDPTNDRKAAPIDKSKMLFKQIPIAVGFYLISPFGNEYYSYFGVDCVEWFVNEMLTLENIASNYFETNLELKITPQEGVASQESFQQSTICWFCENPLGEDTVRDHDHLTGKYQGPAHNSCKLNCKKVKFVCSHTFP